MVGCNSGGEFKKDSGRERIGGVHQEGIKLEYSKGRVRAGIVAFEVPHCHTIPYIFQISARKRPPKCQLNSHYNSEFAIVHWTDGLDHFTN